MEFKITKRTILFLIVGVVLLAVINVLNFVFHKPFWTVTKIFYLGFDDNFSAWYSSMLLFIAGVLSYTCWNKMKHRELLWFSMLLFLMSADEIAQFHETAGHLLTKYLHISGSSVAKYFCHSGWIWILGPSCDSFIYLFSLYVTEGLFWKQKGVVLFDVGIWIDNCWWGIFRGHN